MLQQLGLAELCWPHLAHVGVSTLPSACGDSAAVGGVVVRPSAGATSTSSAKKRIFGVA